MGGKLDPKFSKISNSLGVFPPPISGGGEGGNINRCINHSVLHVPHHLYNKLFELISKNKIAIPIGKITCTVS